MWHLELWSSCLAISWDQGTSKVKEWHSHGPCCILLSCRVKQPWRCLCPHFLLEIIRFHYCLIYLGGISQCSITEICLQTFNLQTKSHPGRRDFSYPFWLFLVQSSNSSGPQRSLVVYIQTRGFIYCTSYLGTWFFLLIGLLTIQTSRKINSHIKEVNVIDNKKLPGSMPHFPQRVISVY